jgi:hypothetical protein
MRPSVTREHLVRDEGVAGSNPAYSDHDLVDIDTSTGTDCGTLCASIDEKKGYF